MVAVDRTKCIRCGKCIQDCTVHVLHKGPDGFPVLDESGCIRCGHCLAICPAGAVECWGKTAADCEPIRPLPSPESLIPLFRQRRSVRKFRPDSVNPEILAKLKENLAWSPTGCNDHSLVFSIAEVPEQMDLLREATRIRLKRLYKSRLLQLFYPPSVRYLSAVMQNEDVIYRGAPHIIVAAIRDHAPCVHADPVIALTQFEILAQTFGLGTCWCGFAVYAFKYFPALRRMLNLPRGYHVEASLLFGHPAVEYARTTAPAPFHFREIGQKSQFQKSLTE